MNAGGTRLSKAWWAQVEALLDDLETVPENAREAYLARECSDPVLRREVLTLLAAEDSRYLDDFAQELKPNRERGKVPNLAGTRIGAWRLLRPLGRGGMGVVYEAERADGAFEQRTALKLLATALTGSEAHDRFLAERRILAGLEHPSIAGIVDGGVTGDGTPWFAMEYVEGMPIHAFCDRYQLGIRERLELVLRVCDAVEHAHRRLVVHRDLKPANVLVAAGGDHRTGEPDSRAVKLLDFGIAKLLDASNRHEAPVTRASLRLMTPEYASPEQVRGQAVTTASDVYQLGLLLYELLTGHRPHTLKRHSAGELERVICEQSPTRPSSMINTARAADDGITDTICRARRSTPARLRRRLRGDLENIVLKALSKEPARRYGSADRLAEDIRRHLQGLPVSARADTWLYRGWKFVGRHAVGAATAGVLLAFAAAMTTVYTVRVQRERDIAQMERHRAEAETVHAQEARDRAEAEAAKARQVSQFLASLFRSADPRQARGVELTSRELLDRGVQQVERDLAGQPELQSEMLQVLGRTYLEMGHYDAAEPLLLKALGIRQNHPAPPDPEAAGLLRDLGLLFFYKGKYRDARARLESAVSLYEIARMEDPVELVETYLLLGSILQRLGEYDRSLATLEHALVIQGRISGEDSVPVADILVSLGALFIRTGDYVQAERHVERALALYENGLGPDHPLVGNPLTNLANIRILQQRFDEAEAMYRRTLALQEKAYGGTHLRLGMTLSNLGHLLTLSERYEEALDVLHQSHSIHITAGGQAHPQTAYSFINLGRVYFLQGRFAESGDNYRQSIEVREKLFGNDEFDPLVAKSLVRLALIETELGNRAAAEELMDRAAVLWARAPAAVDLQFTPVLLAFAHWLSERGRCTDAATLIGQVDVDSAAQLPLLRPLLAEAAQWPADCAVQQQPVARSW